MRVLLIPLGLEQFRWFMMAHWVLCHDKWPRGALSIGGEVVIRQGKSGVSLPGTVSNLVRGSLNQVLSKVGHDKLVPMAGDRSLAKVMAQKFIGTYDRYVAFKWRTN